MREADNLSRKLNLCHYFIDIQKYILIFDIMGAGRQTYLAILIKV